MIRLHLYLFFLFTFCFSFIYAGDGIKFIENKGQWKESFLYKANLGNGALFLEETSFTYNFYNADNYHFHNFNANETSEELKSHAFRINFLGANKNPIIENRNIFSEYYNYFLGKNKKHWNSNIKAYQKIYYNNIYNQIDLTIYSLGAKLKYDVIINPRGNIKDVQFEYEGHDKLKIDKNGNLHITTSVNEIIEQKPYAYQNVNGEKIEVLCKFIIKGNVLSFKTLKPYNKNLPLIIDPVLIFSSYSGSNSDNFGMTATYGFDGSLFAGGTAFNVGYPTTLGAFDTSFNGSPAQRITDIVITRYDSTGTNLIYSTYIGGSQAETVHSIIANENDELFLYGVTGSSDFPVTSSASDTTFNGGVPLRFVQNGTFFNNGTDIYVAKLNGTGTSLLGCTYIGGSLNDGVNHTNVLINIGNTLSPAYDSLQNNYSDQYRGEIMLDKNNNCYIASSSRSSNFPIINGFDSLLNGLQDGVVFKFNSSLTKLIWSTYIGGKSMDAAYSIKVDTNNIVYVSGGTTSDDFPATFGTINSTYQGGIDGYIAKIDSNGSSILAATFLGTSNYDQCYFVDIDRFGSVYTVGQTRGTYPVINASYSNPNSGQFIVKMNNDLTTVNYSTVFGNGNVNSFFSPSAFLVDRCENVYVSGWGGDILSGGLPLTGMPTSQGAFQPSSGDGFNFYLFVLERNAQSLLYGTYFGGNQSGEHVDGGTSRFDKNGIVYQSVCAGCWGNSDFPTEPNPGAWSNTNNSTGCNNGVFKFDFEIIPKAKFTVDNFLGCAPFTVIFTNTSNASDTYLWDFGGGDTTSQIFNPIKTFSIPGTYFVSLLITDSICNTVDTAFQTITVVPPITISGGNIITTCNDTATFSISTTGNPSGIIWSSNNQFSDTLNANNLDSNLFVTVTDTTWFYVMATNGICSVIDSFLFNYTGFQIQTQNSTICEGDTTILNLTNLSNQLPIIYIWTPTNTIISGSNTATPAVNPVITTTYYVTATNTFGCLVNDSIIIIVIPEITITGGNIVTICDTATLIITTTGNPATIIWSSNNQFTDTLALNTLSLFISPTDTTWYYVSAVNGFCNAIDSFLVNYTGFQIQIPNGAICSGNNDTLEIITQSTQILTYNWTPTANILSDANTANPIVNPTITTTYYVTVSNNFGCVINDSALVVVSGFDAANIIVWADEDSLYGGEGTQLHVLPNTGFSYQWIPPFNLDNSTISDPTATPTPPSTTNYTVLLTENGSNCEFLKMITIYAFEIVCGEPDVFLPNAFTPNADNENDVLFVRGKAVEKVLLKIYDRWGELVFETNKQSVGWDGTYKGDLVDPGVFVYYMEITCVDGQEYFKKGNITVIR